MYIKDGVLLIIYVENSCIISHIKDKIQQEAKSLQKDYILTDDGELQDYIGTRFKQRKDISVILTMPRLIDRLVTIVGLDSKNTLIKLRDTPANVVLYDDHDASP